MYHSFYSLRLVSLTLVTSLLLVNIVIRLKFENRRLLGVFKKRSINALEPVQRRLTYALLDTATAYEAPGL